MELPSTHVALPQDVYAELQDTAYGQTSTPAERIAGTVQTTIVFAALAGAVTGGAWGIAKAMDWFEEKNFQRKQREKEYARNTK